MNTSAHSQSRSAARGRPRQPAPPSPKSTRGHKALAGGTILLLAMLAHAWSIPGQFLYDDDYWICNNPVDKAGAAPWGYWQSTDMVDYWPAASTLFYIQTRLWGQDLNRAGDALAAVMGGNPTGSTHLPTSGRSAAPYRAVSVSLHALACLLIWQVLCAWGVPAAWLGAALFAVHPITVASSGWISEQKNTLSLIFFCLSLLAYGRFESTDRPWAYMAAAAAFALALLSKTSAVVLPAILIVLLWLRRRPLKSRRTLAALAGLTLLAAADAIINIRFQHADMGHEQFATPHGAQRLLLAARAIFFYLANTAAPVKLNMIYPKWDLTHLDWTVLSVPALAAWATALFAYRRRPWVRSAAAATACFVLSLAPVLGLVNFSFMRCSYVSDHLMYLSLPVLTATAAAVAAALARRGPRWKRAITACAAAVVVALGVATALRARTFTTETRLWSDTVRKNPDAWLAHQSLATQFMVQHNWPAAAHHFSEAIRCAISPQRAAVQRRALVTAMIQMNQLQEAAEVLRRHDWAGDSPEDAFKNHTQLGSVLQTLNDLPQARLQFEAALSQNVTSLPHLRAYALVNLARICCDQDDANRAVQYARQAVALAPRDPATADALGWAHYCAQQLDPAEMQLNRAVQMTPDAAYRFHLGRVMEARQNKPEAMRQYQMALESLRNSPTLPLYAKIRERMAALGQD
jgi:protein O-mannosyl-transferase